MVEATITFEDLVPAVEGKMAKLVTISGQLDESNVDEKAKEIYGLISQCPKNLFLIFNLENLEYMNSKSIGYMTDWYGKIFEAGGKMYIAKARANILDILQVVGLTQLIQAFSSVEEAKAAMANDMKV